MTNWWVWERPATVQLIYQAAICCCHECKKEWGESFETLHCFFHKGVIKVYSDFDQVMNAGRRLVKTYLNDEKFNAKKERWEKLSIALANKLKEVLLVDLSEKSDEELLSLHNDFERVYTDWWGFGQIAEIFGFACEEIIHDKAPDHEVILTTPHVPSFTYNEEMERMKLEQAPDTNAAAKEHAKKYHWIHNSFFATKYLDHEYFLSHPPALEKIDFKEVMQKKEKILSSMPELKGVVSMVDYFTIFRDDRKALVIQCLDFIDEFYQEISKRFSIDPELLKWITPDMTKELLKTGKFDLKKAKQMKEAVLIRFHDDTPTEIIVGKEAIEEDKRVFSLSTTEELKGMCAMPGKVTGKVRVITHLEEIQDMQEGEVLVVTMTTPDFVLAMRKASAIVTDEGGVTSHASIMAREMKTPCVIGTLVATRTLKTGDTIEVDADNGIVRILQE